MSHIEWKTTEIGAFKKLDMSHPFPPRHAKQCFDSKGIPLRKCEPRNELLRAWVNATLDLVAKQECLAANCCDGGACFSTDGDHPAVYEAAELIAGAAHFLDDPRADALPEEKAALIYAASKYLPCLRLMYDRDGDAPKIALLEKIVVEAATSEAPPPTNVAE